MDAVQLPRQQPFERTYKHFTFDSVQEITEGKVEFFYIGKDARKIDFLIQSFGSGYAAENAQKAITILGRIANNNTIPDIIIIDPAMGDQALEQISLFISDSKVYASIPLVIDASGLSNNDLEKYRSLNFLDEIIFLDGQNAEKLVSKVEFLKKVKGPCYNYKVESSFQELPAGRVKVKNILKRIFDIVISLLFIILLSPVFLLIALAIKFESKGPVVYISKRAGRGYRIFNFYKFRTMIIDADQKVQQLSHLNHYNDDEQHENGPVFFKVVNDNRITKVGAFLRNTSMDELPQFVNVLLGNMSLVGNRPLPLYEAAKLTTNDWAERFMAPAGMTGLWQVKKKKQVNMSMEERIELDIAYSKRYNFMYDLWIMANTPSALIQKPNS